MVPGARVGLRRPCRARAGPACRPDRARCRNPPLRRRSGPAAAPLKTIEPPPAPRPRPRPPGRSRRARSARRAGGPAAAGSAAPTAVAQARSRSEDQLAHRARRRSQRGGDLLVALALERAADERLALGVGQRVHGADGASAAPRCMRTMSARLRNAVDRLVELVVVAGRGVRAAALGCGRSSSSHGFRSISASEVRSARQARNERVLNHVLGALGRAQRPGERVRGRGGGGGRSRRTRRRCPSRTRATRRESDCVRKTAFASGLNVGTGAISRIAASPVHRRLACIPLRVEPEKRFNVTLSKCSRRGPRRRSDPDGADRRADRDAAGGQRRARQGDRQHRRRAGLVCDRDPAAGRDRRPRRPGRRGRIGGRRALVLPARRGPRGRLRVHGAGHGQLDRRRRRRRGDDHRPADDLDRARPGRLPRARRSSRSRPSAPCGVVLLLAGTF